jgi:multidrug resistance efflux pump
MPENRIPVSRTIRLRRIRAQLIPAATFLLASAGTIWLWMERNRGLQIVGEVSSPRVDVTSPVGGLLTSLPNRTQGNWSLYDRVEAGEVIARIGLDPAGGGQVVDVLAPLGGTLVDIPCWPGQAVAPGQRLATIAAGSAQHVVSYVPEGERLQLRPGMRVTVRGRSEGAPLAESEVERVGHLVEEIPTHQRSTSAMRQWGTPVRIKLPGQLSAQPGALVDVTFYDSAGE